MRQRDLMARFRKRIRGTLMAVAALAAATVAPTGSLTAGPQLEIVNPTMNFGRVTQNKIITTDFWIKSTGDEPLKITVLWAGCGCAEIPLPDSTVMPGDSMQMRVRFATGRYQGVVHKRPTVRTNASLEVIKLSILAEVLVEADEGWPVVLRPDVLDVSQFGEKTRRMGKFHVENRSDEDLRVVVVDSALKSFDVKIPDEVKAGETIEGRIRVDGEMLEQDFEESVTLRIEGAEPYYYTLPVVRRYRSLDRAGQ